MKWWMLAALILMGAPVEATKLTAPYGTLLCVTNQTGAIVGSDYLEVARPNSFSVCTFSIEITAGTCTAEVDHMQRRRLDPGMNPSNLSRWVLVLNHSCTSTCDPVPVTPPGGWYRGNFPIATGCTACITYDCTP